MPDSFSPWWWAPELAPGAFTAVPIQSPWLPASFAEIPASRLIPGVCAVPASRSNGRITFTMPGIVDEVRAVALKRSGLRP
jgi:hypothetical protein